MKIYEDLVLPAQNYVKAIAKTLPINEESEKLISDFFKQSL